MFVNNIKKAVILVEMPLLILKEACIGDLNNDDTNIDPEIEGAKLFANGGRGP